LFLQAIPALDNFSEEERKLPDYSLLAVLEIGDGKIASSPRSLIQMMEAIHRRDLL
jgi:hypothetical protein